MTLRPSPRLAALSRLLAVAVAAAAAALGALAAPATLSAAEGVRIAFSEYDLPNGLHVILAPEHSSPVFASYVLYHVGSKNERPDRTGFAHFFEHLMFEGTDNIGRGQIFKDVTAAGGNLNASTSFDQTDFYINLPSNQYGLALWIESERMMHAKIEQIGVDTQRQVVKEERRLRYDNQPYGGLFEEVSKLVFAGTPYSWVPIGSVQYIDQATLEEFRQFYKTYYLPNNATLVLSGDFDPEKIKGEVEAYFGPIPRGPQPPQVQIVFSDKPSTLGPLPVTTGANDSGTYSMTSEVQTAPAAGLPPGVTRWTVHPRPAQTVNVDKQNTPLPASLHAWLAPKETDVPDAYAVEMLTNILANGRSSRLYRRLVDTEQAAVEASAFPYLLEDAGMVGVFAVGNQGVTLERLDALIDEEVNKVRQDGVTEEEFQKARNQKESEVASSYGTVLARAEGLAHYHVYFHNTGLVNTELDDYLKVTRDDLKRAANKYFVPQSTDILHYPVPTQPKELPPHPRPTR